MSKRKDIEKFREDHGVTFPVGKARGVAQELRVKTIPEMIFLTPDGRFAKRLRGKVTDEEIREGIEEILR